MIIDVDMYWLLSLKIRCKSVITLIMRSTIVNCYYYIHAVIVVSM
jgi:hypothetical protein